MKELTIFHLTGCPYCRNAKKAYEELKKDAVYGQVPVKWVEERANAALADQYDYFYVPSVFMGKEKLYECSRSDDYDAIYEHLEAALKQAAEV